MALFTVKIFLNPDGTQDESKRVILLKRGTLHPGVFSKFFEEAGGKLEDYVRGVYNHKWAVSAEAYQAFALHLQTFSKETLDEHFKELRMLFPKVSKYSSIGEAMIASQPEEDAGNDPDEDEDEDEE